MNTMKSVDQLDQSTADHIWKWLVPQAVPTATPQQRLSGSRAYLRNKKLTPYEALEQIEKITASMPKRIF